MDDLKDDPNFSLNSAQQPKALASLLSYAQSQNKKQVYKLTCPLYDIAHSLATVQMQFLPLYAYNIDTDKNNIVAGPAFTALANVLLGNASANGELPVTIK
ncbi:hypothetical protein ACOBV9_22715 (plasmid) [Pseudoalteromonas espejiana]